MGRICGLLGEDVEGLGMVLLAVEGLGRVWSDVEGLLRVL